MAKEYTYCEDSFSDLYKDANGFRPRSHEFYADDTTPDRKQEIWDSLLEDLDAEFERQREADAANIADFEKLVAQNMEMGAVDRKTAVQWLLDAEDDDYVSADPGYFNYLYGLPYGYNIFEGKAA